jgi:hypothetical protein
MGILSMKIDTICWHLHILFLMYTTSPHYPDARKLLLAKMKRNEEWEKRSNNKLELMFLKIILSWPLYKTGRQIEKIYSCVAHERFSFKLLLLRRQRT